MKKMNWADLFEWGGWFGLVLVWLSLGLMFIYSLVEKEKRAATRSGVLFFLFLVFLGGKFIFTPQVFDPFSYLGVSLGWLALLTIFLILVSPAPRGTIKVSSLPARVDERDVIFARFDLEKDSPLYEEYYHQHEHLRSRDEEIRRLPDLLDRSYWEKSPWEFALAEAEFDFIEELLTLVEQPPLSSRFTFPPDRATVMVKRLALYLGAKLCGVAAVENSFIYSHVGRGPEPYGQPISLQHPYAIVFAVEMDLAMVANAPQAPVVVETSKRYTEAAHISIVLAKTIQKLGYSARAHIAGSNYQVMLPPLAWKAGLGELGRSGIIITYPYGPRVRLGVVTTDLPLIPDKPVSFGVQDFCAACLKCARCCPAQAISKGERQIDNGVTRWVIDREACYRFWRQVGTDCATCLFVCPYSKENNFFHRVVREITRSSKLAQKLAVRGDDFFYGSRPQARSSPLVGLTRVNSPPHQKQK
ncbi:MAG TPA: reductive dehalogenase [Candidatus Aminicenantes bacterium]|nr:reductive dehalogenase [Candidatus Aminicenantes bacterium]